jgi:hypothetical protein
MMIVGLRTGARHGDLRPELALRGDAIEPFPLLAGVSSPANGTRTVTDVSEALTMIQGQIYHQRKSRSWGVQGAAAWVEMCLVLDMLRRRHSE